MNVHLTDVFRQKRSWLLQAVGAAASLSVLSPMAVWAQPASQAAAEAAAPPLPQLGERLQVPPIVLLNGQRFDAAQHDKPLLVYWWASTCPFCALQSPAMQALWQTHRHRFAFLGLSIDRDAHRAQQYLTSRGYTFPSAWVSPEWRQTFPKPQGLPITLMLDARGKVLAAERGQLFNEDVADLARFLG